jgi:hypothetical protein
LNSGHIAKPPSDLFQVELQIGIRRGREARFTKDALSNPAGQVLPRLIVQVEPPG